MQYILSKAWILYYYVRRLRHIFHNDKLVFLAKCDVFWHVLDFLVTKKYFCLIKHSFSYFPSYCNTGSSNSENKSKFRLYSYYAWICPLLMTFGVILSTVYVDKDSIWSTGIGNQGCFIQGRSIEGAYFSIRFAYPYETNN